MPLMWLPFFELYELETKFSTVSVLERTFRVLDVICCALYRGLFARPHFVRTMLDKVISFFFFLIFK